MYISFLTVNKLINVIYTINLFLRESTPQYQTRTSLRRYIPISHATRTNKQTQRRFIVLFHLSYRDKRRAISSAERSVRAPMSTARFRI